MRTLPALYVGSYLHMRNKLQMSPSQIVIRFVVWQLLPLLMASAYMFGMHSLVTLAQFTFSLLRAMNSV